jgi:hypothetical protein
MVDTSRLGETPTPNIINELIQDEEIEVINMSDKQKNISKEDRDLYDQSIRGLVRNMNQSFYRRFKQQLGTNVIPVYAQYVKSGNSKSIKIYMRKDWLKKKFEANLSFTEWLQKKGKRRWARKYQEYIDGKNVNQQKPHWIKNMWNEWQEEGGIDKMFNENKAKGVVAFKSKYVYELEDQISEKNPNIAARINQAYTQPLQGEDFKKLVDPENENFIFGDTNVKNYFSSSMSDESENKIYREVMKNVLDEYWKVYEQVQAVGLSTPDGLENVAALTEFEADFPNIARIRRWFTDTGIYNTSPHHQYTLEKWQSLRSNQSRANFIDRATFLIANSIYIKSNNMKVGKTNKGYMNQSAGKKVPISRARRYNKYSKDRTKYSTERVKEYDSWRIDNRKVASSLKRTTNREDKRKKSR